MAWWLLSNLCTPLQNGYVQVFVQFIEQLPIPEISTEVGEELDRLVLRLIDEPNDDDAEASLESLVAESYGLSAAEFEMIRDSLGAARVRDEIGG